MFTAILIFTVALFATGAVFIAAIHRVRGFESAHRKTDWLKYAVYVVVIYAVLLIGHSGRDWLATLLILIIVRGSFELYRSLQYRKASACLPVVALSAGMIVCFGHLMTSQSQPWPYDFFFVFLLVAVTDSFSQLWGRLVGRHQLWMSVSPNKTVEGFIGGTVTAALAAVALQFLKPGISISGLVLIGLVIALAATAGDLLFSWIKRRLQIKDFSGLLPGHGGLLDRFDSLLIASPVFYWTDRILFG